MVTSPTGQIVGCDPIIVGPASLPFLAPYTTTVPAGRYPLYAWVATIRRGEHEPQERVAALQLVVDDQPPARWELALPEGMDHAELDEDGLVGYTSEAGTGTLADVVAVRALCGWEDGGTEVFIPADDVLTQTGIDVVTDEATGANVIAVQSGWGDGFNPTFIGFADDGAVTSFVTDFSVIPDERTVRPRPAPGGWLRRLFRR
jgi:hypothetical protein